MKYMTVIPPEDKRIYQLIDANLDRAREGLRVLEDWCRYSDLDIKDLIKTLKNWRHSLGLHHHNIYRQARCTIKDQGLGLSHSAQAKRDTPEQIIIANASRVQEALRVLEEFSRNTNPSLAKDAAEIRYGLYQLEIDLINKMNSFTRRKKLQDCYLYLITSDNNNLKGIILEALKSGIQMVQYRCKEGSDNKKIKEATEIAKICQKFNSLFIINDRVDIAIATQADGVHLGQDDMPTAIARNLLGKDRLIGRSTHSVQQVLQAEIEGCDYIGAGPIYTTKTKPISKLVGPSYLIDAYKNTNLPCFAIGGINSLNIKEVRSTGVKRVAICDAIMNSEKPGHATKKLLNSLLCN